MSRRLMAVLALGALSPLAPPGMVPMVEPLDYPPPPLPAHLAQLQHASDEAIRRAEEKRARKNAIRLRQMGCTR